MMKSSNFAADNWINTCYSLGDKLGEGGFGIVRRAVHLLTGESVAIKIMNKARLGKDLQHIYQEISTMKNLMHQNICRLYQVVETKREIYLILEYCEQGEMFDYIVTKNKLPEPEARHFFRQLVQAMAYTHRQGYAHRDLKPENLLLKGESRQLKVIDFGLSSQTGRQLDTYCGSLCYAAPEIIMNRPYNGPAADIWSMGVLLYILVTGSAPFNSEDQRKISYSITHGVYKMPDKLSPECQDLIRGMLTVDVSKRLRMDQIMAHSWVMEGYNMLKATTVYQKDIFDDDVVTEMAMNQRRLQSDIIQELKQWRFDYNTATYLALWHKKENNGLCILPSYMNKRTVVNSPTLHASLEKNLDEYGSARNKREAELLFDNNRPEFLHGPVTHSSQRSADKENIKPTNPFATPKRQPETPVKPSVINARRTGSLPRPALFQANKPIIQTPVIRVRQPDSKQSPVVLSKPAEGKSSTSYQSTASDTPPQSYADRPSRSTERTSRRARLVTSLERGGQRMFEMLTPRRLRRDNSQVKVCKNYVNVSVTNSDDPLVIRDKIKESLEQMGCETVIEGWKIRGEDAKAKISVEMEVVWIELLKKIGVKRKRIKGDSFQYKKICEAVLQLSA